jgi:hypothetical protein
MPFCHIIRYCKSKTLTIKTELKQVIEYQTSIVLDSGESIPTDFQKFPLYMMSDVKHDLRNKERLEAGGKRNVNKKNDIYSGDLQMDTVGVGYFL